MTDLRDKANGQRRLCRLLRLLAGREIKGVRPGEMAKALAAHPSNITRDLQVLREEGLVEPVPGLENCWRLGPLLLQIANDHQQGMARHAHEVAELTQRASRAIR